MSHKMCEGCFWGKKEYCTPRLKDKAMAENRCRYRLQKIADER
jgi:hypothetical protein